MNLTLRQDRPGPQLARPEQPAAGPPAPARLSPEPLSPARLASVVAAIAASPALWRPLVRFSAERRWYYRLDQADPNPAYELWLLSWLPGQQTGFHDHGDASGAFAVADGELLESTAQVGRREIRSRSLVTGAVRSFGPAYLHDVRNAGDRPAVSVHAYSPALSLMRRYEMAGSGLVQVGAESADDGW
jgi:predicted metal-dependent enzyme (double-stranded beta helix superfamily)